MNILLLFMFLVFIFLGTTNTNPTPKNFGNLTETTCFRGILAIIVVLSHMELTTFNYFNGFGIIGVSGFFFLSGYCLFEGLKNTANYLKGINFIFKRLITVLIPYYICLILYIAILHNNFNLTTIIQSILLVNYTVVSYSWYVAVILIFYLAFYIIFKFSRNIKHGIIIFLIFNLIYMIIAKIIVQQRYIFCSSYCFSLGLLYSYYIKDINKILKNINIKILFLVTTIIFTIYLMLNFKFNFNSAFETLYTLGLPAIFTIWFLLFFSIFNFGNKFNLFLGKISYEIYLLQGLVFNVLKTYFHIQNDWIFIIFSLIIITILSLIINYIYKLIYSKLIIFFK